MDTKKSWADNTTQLFSYILIVELEGVEPSSKQGNHTFSTRLFQPLIFVLRQDLDHQPQPYPLKFHLTTEA